MMTFTLLMTSGGVSFALDLQKGSEAYQKGDYAKALREWRPLAEQGDANAQSNLGQMYQHGRGVVQDYEEALKWFRKSAEQRGADGQYNLGQLYLQGHGVAQNYSEAFKWYRRSAEQGHAKAQVALGEMYAKGRGVAQDFVFAHMWFNIAASAGFSEAIKNRDIIARRMTASQIAEARKLARECLEWNYKIC